MRSGGQVKDQTRGRIREKLGKIMNCICSGDQLLVDEMVPSSESLATKDYSASVYSSRATDADKKPDTGNIEEAESSLRESGCLNYEEARALLGRYEYQKGNIQAALHVFEGIDIAAVTPKMKITLAKRGEARKRRSEHYADPPMSIHAVSLLLEAVFLKSKCLLALRRYKEAAQSCKVILDIVESSLPGGLPENFGNDCKLQETLNKAVKLLPELWELANSPREVILSYRRALLHHWNLDVQNIASIQIKFAIFLLYSGGEANAPDLRSQMDSSFVPKNNIEEAILLLMVLLKKMSLKIIEWDPFVLHHLSYALSISGGLMALANQVEELLPGTIDRKERYHLLSLCYYGEGDNITALNLLRRLLSATEDPTCVPALLFASKICGENSSYAEEGVKFAQRTIENLQGKCDHLVGVADCLLGVSLSAHSRSILTDFERAKTQSEALKVLEDAGRTTKMVDPNIIYHLCLENAEQRKLDAALNYAKCLLKLEGGANLRGWRLLTRILSAQKLFVDAEIIVNAALDQTGKWDQGELLRTKAKLQIAQDRVKDAIGTYTQLLALLQVQSKSSGLGKKLQDREYMSRSLELETWNDLSSIYIKLSRWHDVEICLLKSESINPCAPSTWHITGLLYEAKGLHREAARYFARALDYDPAYVPSLVSMAVSLRQIKMRSPEVIRTYLTEALRLDRMNASAWYNLGLLYKEEGSASAKEAAECFEAAVLLEETEPIEPFR